MSAKYTIRRWPNYVTYHVLNPSGVVIARGLSWRVARKIADLYNADVEWRRYRDGIWTELSATIETRAVSLQEEA